MTDSRQEARRIIGELARAVDRKLAVEVRDVPGQERLQVNLTHGTHQAHIELAIVGDTCCENSRINISRSLRSW